MDAVNYKQWRIDAGVALRCRYSNEEAITIITWMDNSLGKWEYALVGRDVMEAIQTIDESHHYNLYNSLMMRMWLYAPYILNDTWVGK